MAVRFKLDENLPRDTVALLRDAGYDVQTVLEERLGGSADAEVLDVCRSEGRVLVTFDLDFSDVRLYPPATHSGIWVLRPQTQSIDSALTLLKGALRVLKTESTQGRLWIVEPGQVRVRE
jgi:predicted nuclease of predicted toxin-antitoxin system